MLSGLGDGQRRAPLVFQDIQTDRSVRRDVAVIDLRRKVDLCPVAIRGSASGHLHPAVNPIHTAEMQKSF